MTKKYPHDPYENDSRSMKERMLAGDMYIADDPELAKDHERARHLMAQIERVYVDDFNGAQDLINELLGYKGKDSVVLPPVFVDYGYNTHVGRRTFINAHLTALDVAEIRIGEDVQIGPNVQLLTATHPIDPVLRKAKWEAASPIVIEDNVWLGGGVIVLPGVTIGENSIVGAGAVVTRSVPRNVIAVGNPARVLRSIYDK